VNVCVSGLWHLGSVTAACLAAAGHTVVGLDADRGVVDALDRGVPPVFEPGLTELIAEGTAAGRLRFVTDPAAALAAADVVWVASDTPVDDNDRADVEAVVAGIERLFPHLRRSTLVLISSQVPVGTTARLERSCAGASAGREVRFAYAPENLRLGTAIKTFTQPDRVVVGTRSDQDREVIAHLLAPFTARIEWMTVESAEMVKHALNAFLATSITFINEIATLCEQVGADAADVQRGLKTDVRIGPRAYLSPGAAFAGGTLARDVAFLSELGGRHGVVTPLMSAVKTSNDVHRQWAQRRLHDVLGDLAGKTIAVWGLTYKPGTDTLRRSSAVELCEWLSAQRATINAHDPAVTRLPDRIAATMSLTRDPLDAITGADALVVATAWPEYREVDAAAAIGRMRGRLVLDANGFLSETLGRSPEALYLRVGQPVR
jgi:UDPglucose 6-dehydrogenase